MTALGSASTHDRVQADAGLLTIFALFAAFLLGYFAWNTRRLITEQITQTVDEITGLPSNTGKAASAAWCSLWMQDRAGPDRASTW